jgi:hypothetical protein
MDTAGVAPLVQPNALRSAPEPSSQHHAEVAQGQPCNPVQCQGFGALVSVPGKRVKSVLMSTVECQAVVSRH